VEVMVVMVVGFSRWGRGWFGAVRRRARLRCF
jgi:hypothetical protein